jgi:putative aldouronate transport system substrate-binding protein
MKKSLWVLAALVLPALVFVGCAKGKDGNVASSGSSGQPAEITVEVFDRGTDGGKSNPTDNNWTKWIQEKLLKDENIAVTFVPIPRNDEIPALNNLMSSGNPPDICITYSNELLVSYSEQGGLFDMAPYTNTLMKDLRAFLGPDPTFQGQYLIERKKDSTTGRVYAVPARRTNLANHNVFIRKDWLDKLGLQTPKSKEEFFTTLAAFKAQDPGGVGKNRVSAFILGTSRLDYHIGMIIESFRDPKLSRRDRWVNTTPGFSFMMPGTKDGFRYLNRMYNAGLMTEDFPLYKDDMELYSVVKSGVVGTFEGNWDHIFQTQFNLNKELAENISGAEFIPIDCFESSDGITHKGSYDPEGVYFFIPKSSKNPEAAMRYMNWLSHAENYSFLQLGNEGTNHEIVNGIPRIIPATGLWIQNSGQNIDYTINVNGIELGDAEKNIRALAFSYPSVDPDMVVRAYETSMKNAEPGPIVQVTLTEAGRYNQTLIDKSMSLATQLIRCAPSDFDRVWETGVRDYLTSGGQVIIDERREKYIE